MELKQLFYFQEIARHGSINRAAGALFLSQPYLSRVVKDLEEELQVRLLIRNKKGVNITPEGERFLKYAHKITSQCEELKTEFRQKVGDQQVLSVSMTKFSHVMEAFIEVCAENEHLERFTYRLNEGSPYEVIHDVKNQISHIGVIHFNRNVQQDYHRLLLENGLEYHYLATLEPQIVISKDHPVIQKNPTVLDLEDLREYGFVRYIGEFEDFIYTLRVNDREVDLDATDKIIYIYGRASLLHVIGLTNFYTVGIRDFETQREAYHAVSMPIKNCQSKLEFGYVLTKNAVLSPVEQRFLTTLRQLFAE